MSRLKLLPCVSSFLCNECVLTATNAVVCRQANQDEWEREIAMRKLDDGNTFVDYRHVMCVLPTQSVELPEQSRQFCSRMCWLYGAESGQPYGYLLVMPQAHRDMSDLLSHDRIAGRQHAAVRRIMRQVAMHLQYLHEECGRIHGDLKPRNIVEILRIYDDADESSNGNERNTGDIPPASETTAWILIDLDASCKIGSLAGQKVTSSACFPPEMARSKHPLQSQGSEADVAVKATPAFEAWYFGLLLYQLCTTDGDTLWKMTQADNLVREDDWDRLAYCFEEEKLTAAARIRHSGPEWQSAADLAMWCLQPDPSRRPQSMADVLRHPYFNAEQGTLQIHHGLDHVPAIEGEDATLLWAHKLHTAVVAGECDVVVELFQQGSVHYNLPLTPESSILPVHRVAHQNDAEMLLVLLAEVHEQVLPHFLNTQTKWGYTALHWCAVYNSVEVARVLIEMKCDTSILNSRGKTAWDLADMFAAEAVLELFRSSNYEMLFKEHERRQRRPAVVDTFRDDIELEHVRLTFWDIQRFGSWKKIAEGGFGVVYERDDISPPVQLQLQVGDTQEVRYFRRMAVKVPKPEGVDELKAEVEALSKLTHENVVAILGMTEGLSPSANSDAEKQWMMCLEFCESDLCKMLYPKSTKDGSGAEYSTALVQRICRQIVDGMVYVHSQTVLLEGQSEPLPMRHLDLKPENILLAQPAPGEWVAKVADFGWRPDLPPDEWTGTTHFMAPEFAVVQGLSAPDRLRPRTVGQPADVFSFGVMLWQMVGRVGLDEWGNGWKLRATHIPESFPPTLKLLVEACWELAPDDRLTFRELRRLLADEVIGSFAVTSLSDCVAAPVVAQTSHEKATSWLESLGFLSDPQITAAVGFVQVEGNGELEFCEMEDDDLKEMMGEDEMKLSEEAQVKFLDAVGTISSKPVAPSVSGTMPATARNWLNALGFLTDAQINEAVAYTQEEGEPRALVEMDAEDFDEMVEEMKVSTAFHILYDVYQPRL